MSNNLDISILIPCFNEHIHITRCIESALTLTSQVYLIDSYSTDGTLEIASKYNLKIFQYKWEQNTVWADKINWALENIPFLTKWVMRLDSDEYLTDNVHPILEKNLASMPDEINGIFINRRQFFLRKWMKHGNNTYSEIRIFRRHKVLYNIRLLDEYISLPSDQTIKLNCDIIDDNLNDLSTFINKHNKYSTFEAIEIIKKDIYANKDMRKSRYYSSPKYLRAIILFLSKYIFHLGFLDGKEGFLYCFLQCLWYRMLCDAKADEILSNCGKNKNKINQYLIEKYNINLKEC